MQARHIGEAQVGQIGLGAMPMSIEGRPDERRSIATIHAALDVGVTLHNFHRVPAGRPAARRESTAGLPRLDARQVADGRADPWSQPTPDDPRLGGCGGPGPHPRGNR